MSWRKLGRLFHVEALQPWMHSHAANPVARHLKADLYRIYFSSRDSKQRSHICFVDLDIKNPFETVKVCTEPVLFPGQPGAFDDSGVSMSCLAEIDGRMHMFYLGWNLGVTVPWRNSIGLAVEQSDGRFERTSLAPLLDRCSVDPFSISYPWVLKDGSQYHMWYGSNLAWGSEQADMAHLIKYARSENGLQWTRDGKIAVDFENDNEYAISKPCVLRDEEIWRMWYSYRGDKYRIGYAESEDGITWTRQDRKAGITVSSEGWDSEAISYPCVFDHGGQRHLLYNGNKYGLTGFGLAVYEASA